MLTEQQVKKMSYVQLLANIDEVNRPPGGKDSVRQVVQNTFLKPSSKVLDVGCNTGYVTFEIARLSGATVKGVDISPEMIATAKRQVVKEKSPGTVSFQVCDGMDLPFKDQSFDAVVSGGSTAFIPDKTKALKEYARVTKLWGFVADINFFYKRKPPQALLKRLNASMNINIQPWTRSYWDELYRSTGLEQYYFSENDVKVPSKKEIEVYCATMVTSVVATPGAKKLIKDRLCELMSLFAENHKYLAYGVFVLRKRATPEQASLFGA